MTTWGQATEAEAVLDDLVAEISQKLHAGEPVDVAAYGREHPDLAASLRRMLPALQSLAELGPRSNAADALRPTQGTVPARGLLGGAGDDELAGGASDDLIFGGAGSDKLTGAAWSS